MEHVVFYPSAEGPQAFKRVDSLDAAVNFVEHLRNSENITEFSVHALSKVPLSFRAYYHVEVPGEGSAEPQLGEDHLIDAVSGDDDRSAEWVAEADIIEPPAAVPPAPVDEPATVAQFAEAPAAALDAEAEPVNGDVIPSGRRSMGFFSR